MYEDTNTHIGKISILISSKVNKIYYSKTLFCWLNLFTLIVIIFPFLTVFMPCSLIRIECAFNPSRSLIEEKKNIVSDWEEIYCDAKEYCGN